MPGECPAFGRMLRVQSLDLMEGILSSGTPPTAKKWRSLCAGFFQKVGRVVARGFRGKFLAKGERTWAGGLQGN